MLDPFLPAFMVMLFSLFLIDYTIWLCGPDEDKYRFWRNHIDHTVDAGIHFAKSGMERRMGFWLFYGI